MIVAPPPADLDFEQPRATTSRPRWRRSTTTAASTPATRRSRARSRRPSATRSTTRPPGSRRWIVEKFRTWSDCDGDVERCFTKDQLLDNIMLYWLTGTAHSAGRLYYEAEQTARVRARPSGRGARSASRRSPRRSSARPGLGGAALRHPPLDRDAPRWALRGVRRAASCSSDDVREFFRPAAGPRSELPGASSVGSTRSTLVCDDDPSRRVASRTVWQAGAAESGGAVAVMRGSRGGDRAESRTEVRGRGPGRRARRAASRCRCSLPVRRRSGPPPARRGDCTFTAIRYRARRPVDGRGDRARRRQRGRRHVRRPAMAIRRRTVVDPAGAGGGVHRRVHVRRRRARRS